MAKRASKKYRDLDVGSFDDADDLFDDELDVSELLRSEWGDDLEETEERFSARRKIERRRDMRKLYSQLDEFEEFGDRVDW
jgi:hypothetical protein